MIRVKICGITNVKDALYAAELGAHALGFIFYDKSKRYVSPETAREIAKKLPPFVIKVGVFVNADQYFIENIENYCELDRVQIHTDDAEKYSNLSPHKVIMAFRIQTENDIKKAMKSKFFPLLDKHEEGSYGGTGKQFDWNLLADCKAPYILAGGINIDNIDEVLKIKPYAIDIASGVEKTCGIKDHKKMFEIFKKLRENQEI